MLNFTALNDQDIYMQRCLQLAVMGAGHVAPNPMVGAVLVHDNRIIGEGYHRQFGQAHAEVNCINDVPHSLQHLIAESTLYVSLEPCSHFGKTAPCTALIIKNSIPHVVIACSDPFEQVNGKGIRQLLSAGVKVTTGVLEKEALELNRRFFTFHQKQRPYILLKWAQSNNGMIANADRSRVKISNELTNRLVHKWRSEEAAILVGTHTARFDDPSLTTRFWPGSSPVRIVIDRNLQLPAHLHLFDQETKTIIINNRKQETVGLNHYVQSRNINVIPDLLKYLKAQELNSLLVEGGAQLLQSFIDSGCWDEARVITNKALQIPHGLPAPSFATVLVNKKVQVQTDEISFYRNTVINERIN